MRSYRQPSAVTVFSKWCLLTMYRLTSSPFPDPSGMLGFLPWHHQKEWFFSSVKSTLRKSRSCLL